MERLPQRGMVSQDARRQVTAGMGNTASGATVLGPAAASARRGAGGVGTGLGTSPEGVQGGNPASVAQPNTRQTTPARSGILGAMFDVTSGQYRQALGNMYRGILSPAALMGRDAYKRAHQSDLAVIRQHQFNQKMQGR